MKNGKRHIALLAMGIFGENAQGRGIPVLTDLFRRLSQHYEITFYAFGPVNRPAVPDGLRVVDVPNKVPGRIRYAWLAVRFWFDHLFNPYDLLFAVSVFPTGLWAVRLGRLVRKKVVVQAIALEMVSLPDIGAGNLFNPATRRITQRVIENADVVIAVADYQKFLAQQSLPSNRPIIVLPLRIDPSRFPYRKRSVSWPVEFLHVAFYSPVKDQDTMFACFALLSKQIDCRLTVVGLGYNTDHVGKMLSRLDITDKVTFTGQLSQRQLPPYFSRAHVLLHTARFETGCAVIQEAMASGVAVCGTRVGILADLGERYAEIVDPGDHEELSLKVEALIDNPLRYETMTRDAYEWIISNDAAWAAENYRMFLNNQFAEGN